MTADKKSIPAASCPPTGSVARNLPALMFRRQEVKTQIAEAREKPEAAGRRDANDFAPNFPKQGVSCGRQLLRLSQTRFKAP